MTTSDTPVHPGVVIPRQAGAPDGEIRPRDQAPGRQHRHDIDLIRLLGSSGVILSHVGALFIEAVGRKSGNGPGAYWAGMTANAIGAYAVPMFFAIAGWAVLSGAPPKDSRRMWQRLRRTLIPMFVWTALYLLWAHFRDTNKAPVAELAVDSLFGTVRPAYHLWFMYAYLPIIVLLAFVVLLRAGQKPWLMGGVLLALASGPVLMNDLHGLTDRDLPTFGWGFGVYSLVYAVLGAFLLSRPTAPGGRRARIAWLSLAALCAAGVLYYQSQVHYAMPNASIVGAVFTGAIILGLSRIRVPARVRPFASRLANAALGAYLCHILVLDVVADPFVDTDLSGAAAGGLVAGLTVVSIACSFGLSLAWQRLGLKKVLG
ncbi:acyltransferase [Streptomyces sp. NPDC051940]|uniref:acyltransferase n=1 Tax=Streptomyces sp. NPDC051940 TaxID=3155675 RepID=UPI00342640D9